MRAISGSMIACLVVAGCAATDPSLPEAYGRAELRVDLATSFSEITRVTIEAAGESHDLVKSSLDLTFGGTIGLPPGMQLLVAHAFAGDQPVGDSNPTPVDIETGALSRVSLFILDRSTGGQPAFGPLFESLTYPMSVAAGSSVTFTASAVSPAHDLVTYGWASSCTDSIFSSPQGAMTSWTRPTTGTCAVTVTASSGGLTAVRDFSIVVFQGGDPGDGAVSVIASFVPAPFVTLALSSERSLPCNVSPAERNASCADPVASPDPVFFNASADTGFGSTPMTMTDDCGGRVGAVFQDAGTLNGAWLPPVAGGLCILTVRAVHRLGSVGILSVAVVALPGTPASSQPPRISATLTAGSSTCTLSPTPGDCGGLVAGTGAMLLGNISFTKRLRF